MPQKTLTLPIACFILFLGLGLGFLFLLPPFEGIDETGHFSMIRQIAATGTYPPAGEAYLDQTIAQYKKIGPAPYAVHWPHENNGGMTYLSFFSMPDLFAPYHQQVREDTNFSTFTAAEKRNWQEQHPPAYYLLMAPFQKAMEGLSLAQQLLGLRLISFSLALAGYMIGLWGSLRYAKPEMRAPLLTSFALYPVIFAQFTPEFARLGNDSLCLLLIGIFWTLALRWMQNEHDMKGNILLSLVLGLGLLTKALFIPVTAGFVSFALMRVWKGRFDKSLTANRIDALIVMAAPLIICGFWYLYKWKSTGAFLGHYEYEQMTQSVDILQSILSNLNAESLRNSILGVFMPWVWAGTSSLGRFHDFIQYPIMLFALGLIAKSIFCVRHKPYSDPVWLVVWIMAFFLLGIAHHMVAVMAVSQSGATPGWYLHIMAPPLATLMAYTWAHAEKHVITRFVLRFMAIYCGLFLILALWGLMSLFSGCATLVEHQYMAFPDQAFCVTQAPEIFDRLSVIVSPFKALFCFGIAFLAQILTLSRR